MEVSVIGHYSTPLTLTEMKGYFLSGCKKENELAIGMEWEKIGVWRDTAEAITYSGPRGVEAIFQTLVQKNGWEPVGASDGRPIALKKGGSSITLEPGGQIELSGQKARNLSENAEELFSHLKELKQVSDPLGIVWLGIGAQPFSVAHEIEWVPKDRYAIMRKKLAQKGELTYSMMKETASVQVSLDYTNETDAVEKLRLAMALSPVFTALFANSPIEKGKKSPYLSRRAHIWRHTAPERSGILWEIFQPSFTLDDYVEYALNVPLLFLVRDGRWTPTDDLTFKEFLRDGLNGMTARAEDWDLHLTSIFTESRIKKYIEIRSMDCQKSAMGLAAGAFIKGLFYHEPSRCKAWQTVGSWTLEERKRLMEETPRHALKTVVQNVPLLETCRALVSLAKNGLTDDEKDFLMPLEEIVKDGKCPAENLLERLGNPGSKEKLAKKIIHLCEI